MQAEFVEQIIVDLMRRHRKSLAEARDEAVRGLGLSDTSMVDNDVAAGGDGVMPDQKQIVTEWAKEFKLEGLWGDDAEETMQE